MDDVDWVLVIVLVILTIVWDSGSHKVNPTKLGNSISGI